MRFTIYISQICISLNDIRHAARRNSSEIPASDITVQYFNSIIIVNCKFFFLICFELRRSTTFPPQAWRSINIVIIVENFV